MAEQETGFRKTGKTQQLGLIEPAPAPVPEPTSEPTPKDKKAKADEDK